MGQLQVVTKVSQQKRSSDRFNLFLDGKYAFSISEDVYVKFHIHKGKELSAEEIDTIKQADNVQRAYLLAIHYLSYRMRTESEMRTQLGKKELLDDVIEQVIKRLYDEKLLDDGVFARTFVQDRMNRSTKGPQVIRQELVAKGIPMNNIDEALTIFTREKQIERAFQWGQKEMNKRSKQPLRKRHEQLKTKLLRRGYPKDVVFEVVDLIHVEVDEDEEFLLLKKEADKLYNRYKNKYENYELKMHLKQRLYSRGFSLDNIDSYIEKLLNEE
ncbi:MAG TPA: recombination regulator RecX [Pseudogracilibacillus sp.]|nr:recombination regulator RecX [Pseudogracilibacillus sp.]